MNTVKLSLPFLVKIAVILPGSGVFLCVVLSLWYHKELVTGTHCKVSNYLPSISAASDHPPEVYVWRTCIGVHSSFRYLFGYLYYRFYSATVSNSSCNLHYFIKFNFFCKFAEVSSLVMSAAVSSIESWDYHVMSFKFFILFALLHMFCTCYIFFKLGEIRYNQKNYQSLRMKIMFLLLSILSMFLIAYLYWRHNKYCEPGVYSVFAFFEYFFVYCNIGFHATAIYDFQDVNFEVSLQSIQYTGLKKLPMDFWRDDIHYYNKTTTTTTTTTTTFTPLWHFDTTYPPWPKTSPIKHRPKAPPTQSQPTAQS